MAGGADERAGGRVENFECNAVRLIGSDATHAIEGRIPLEIDPIGGKFLCRKALERAAVAERHRLHDGSIRQRLLGGGEGVLVINVAAVASGAHVGDAAGNRRGDRVLGGAAKLEKRFEAGKPNVVHNDGAAGRLKQLDARCEILGAAAVRRGEEESCARGGLIDQLRHRPSLLAWSVAQHRDTGRRKVAVGDVGRDAAAAKAIGDDADLHACAGDRRCRAGNGHGVHGVCMHRTRTGAEPDA